MSFVFRLCLLGVWTSLMVLVGALAHAQSGVLEIPSDTAKLSGIGVISGWKCAANGRLTISFNDGDPIPLPYGNERSDTQGMWRHKQRL